MKQESRNYTEHTGIKNILHPIFCVLIGAIISGGEFVFATHPFGIAVVSAACGFSYAAPIVIGSVIGSVRLADGTLYAAAVCAIFILRLIIGRWLSSPDGREEMPDNVTAARRIFFRVRRYLCEAAEVSFRESKIVRMMIGSTVSLCVGALICTTRGFELDDIVSTVASAICTPILIGLYCEAKANGNGKIKAEAGLCAISITVVLSLGNLIPHADLSPGAAFALVVLTSRYKGSLMGTLYGVICGALLSPELSILYALVGIVSGSLRRISSAVSVCCACAAGILWALYITGLDAMSSITPNLIISAAVVAPLTSSGILPDPNRATVRTSAEFGDKISSYMLRGVESTKRMRSLSESMSDISDMLYRLSERITTPDISDLVEICTDAFEEHCRQCGMKSSCFGCESEKMDELRARMTLQLKNEHRVNAAVVPPDIARRCYSMGSIIDTVNHGVARMVAEAKLYDRTSVVATDYEVMSDVLKESAEYDSSEYECDRELTALLRDGLRTSAFAAESVTVFGRRIKRVIARGVDLGSGTLGSDDIRSLFSSACRIPLGTPEFELDGAKVIMKLQMKSQMSVRCGRASLALSKLAGEALGTTESSENEATKIFSPERSHIGLGKTASEDCGDVISAFLTDDERFFMLISDGMGSGKEAAVTSGVCAVFLERMLCAGTSMDTALRMLNSMLRVRDGECSASVDLMELDLINGKTRFVKSGAAPSFVLRRGRLFRLQSKTVPIGIVRALDAEMIKFEIIPGDIVIMLSDGVARSFEECTWLLDLLSDFDSYPNDPDRMAKKILKAAIQNGASDDITAGVVYIE